MRNLFEELSAPGPKVLRAISLTNRGLDHARFFARITRRLPRLSHRWRTLLLIFFPPTNPVFIPLCFVGHHSFALIMAGIFCASFLLFPCGTVLWNYYRGIRQTIFATLAVIQFLLAFELTTTPHLSALAIIALTLLQIAIVCGISGRCELPTIILQLVIAARAKSSTTPNITKTSVARIDTAFLLARLRAQPDYRRRQRKNAAT